MTADKNTIAISRVKQVIGYDPLTGAFVRKMKTGSRAEIGPISSAPSAYGYMRIAIDGKRFYAHRIAWVLMYGRWPSEFLDHINCNKLDNRICNLREASHGQNQQNRLAPARNKSGFKGVHWNKLAKAWKAEIKADGKRIDLGSFSTPELASLAYQEAAMNMHGSFAKF